MRRLEDSHSMPLSPKISSSKVAFDTEKYLKSGLPKIKNDKKDHIQV